MIPSGFSWIVNSFICEIVPFLDLYPKSFKIEMLLKNFVRPDPVEGLVLLIFMVRQGSPELSRRAHHERKHKLTTNGKKCTNIQVAWVYGIKGLVDSA